MSSHSSECTESSLTLVLNACHIQTISEAIRTGIKQEMPSPTQPEGQSQGPSSPGPFSSESKNPSCSEGKERHWSEQNAGSHHWVTSPKLENSSIEKCENSMKLEDVPSLIETKGGLDSLSKVEQLVFLMQKVQNDNTKKSPDGIRQWIKVAGVIAATEQGNCLNHFIRMGGLNPLDEWLQDAYKGKLCEDDTSKDEFITELLNALETLPIDGDALKACGIKKSVKHLLNHKSPDIQRKAKILVNYWKKRVNNEKAVLDEPSETNNDLVHADFDQSGLVQEGAKFRCSKGFCGKADKPSGNDVQQNVVEVQQNAVPVSTDVLCQEAEKDVPAISQQESLGVKEAGSANRNGVVKEELVSKPSHLESVSNKSCIDGEEAFLHSADGVAPMGMQSCAEMREEDTKPGESEPPESMEFDDGGLRGNSGAHVGEQITAHVSEVKDEHIFKDSQPGLVVSTGSLHSQEISNHSLSDKFKVPVHAEIGSLKGINGDRAVAFHIDDKSKTSEPGQKKGFQLTDSGSISTSIMSSINSSFSDHQPNIQALKVVDGTTNWTGFIEPTSACGIAKDCDTGNGNFASEASGASYSAGNQEDTGTSTGDRTFRKNSARDTGLFDESVSRSNREETSPRRDEKNSEEDFGRDEELDLHFGEDDALEVARQVGKEAEQEVESYDEPLCSSSSERHLKEDPVHSTTTDSVGGEVVEQDVTDTSYCAKEEVDLEVQSRKDDNLKGKCASGEIDISGTNTEVIMQEKESCKITITSQESITHETQAKTSNSNDQIQMPVRCIIDLNEDLPEEDEFSEERVHAPPVATTSASNCTITNVSTPILVVPSSKGPFNLPVSSIHFRGELGWRGSAATSAFRPAEPRRTPERDRTQSGEENNSPLKTLSAEENNSSPKPGKRILEIDLNVADDDGDAVMDLFSRGHGGERHVPASACLPSGDSSVEVSSSRRAERLTLDLNRLCETDDSGPGLHADWRDFNGFGALQKPNRSPSPTSSSRPGRRNFDLNDNPTLEDACAAAHDSEQKRYTIKSNNNPPGLDDPVVSILGSRIDLDHSKLLPAHPSGFISPWDYSNARKDLPNAAESFLVSAPSAVSPLNLMGRMLPMSSVTYQPPPLSFPYNGVALGSSFPVTTTVYGHGPMPYMVESMGVPIPQMVGPPTMSSSFTRPPYLMSSASGMAASNSNGIGRPNLDLNSGISAADIEGREAGIKMRHFFPQGNPMLVEDQRPFQQVASSGPPLKRKEPECGWESYQVGYKQSTSWR